MNVTLFDGLNRLRRQHSLTFNERKHLEVLLHRQLINSEPITLPDFELLNIKRAQREDPRRIDAVTLFQQALNLLTAVPNV